MRNGKPVVLVMGLVEGQVNNIRHKIGDKLEILSHPRDKTLGTVPAAVDAVVLTDTVTSAIRRSVREQTPAKLLNGHGSASGVLKAIEGRFWNWLDKAEDPLPMKLEQKNGDHRMPAYDEPELPEGRDSAIVLTEQLLAPPKPAPPPSAQRVAPTPVPASDIPLGLPLDMVEAVRQGRKMAEFLFVTPEMFADWHRRNIENNREMNDEAVLGYADDMICGRWEPTSQGIGFNVRWELGNGMHTTMAGILAGYEKGFQGVEILVTVGLPVGFERKTDVGRPRTFKDAAKVSGWNLPPRTRAIVSRMLFGRTSQTRMSMSHDLAKEMADRFAEPLDFVKNQLTAPPVKKTSLQAMIANAWFHVDRRKLAEFCQLLGAGGGEGGGAESVRRYWMWLLSGRRGSQEAAVDIYSKGQAVLRAFLEDRKLGNLQAAESDLYPLPAEHREPILRLLKGSAEVVYGVGVKELRNKVLAEGLPEATGEAEDDN